MGLLRRAIDKAFTCLYRRKKPGKVGLGFVLSDGLHSRILARTAAFPCSKLVFRQRLKEAIGNGEAALSRPHGRELRSVSDSIETRRITGLFRRAMTISSPASTRATRSESSVFALCMLTVAMTGNIARNLARNKEGDDMTTSGIIRAGMGGWTFEPWEGTFYPDNLSKKKQLRIRLAAGADHRGQRHLLSRPDAGDLRQMGGRNAGRLRLLGQGQPLRHQPQGAGRGRRIDGSASGTRASPSSATSSAPSSGSSRRTRSSSPTISRRS